jgi:hypothetical protein
MTFKNIKKLKEDGNKPFNRYKNMKKVVNASKIIEKGLIAKIANCKVQKTTRGIKYRKKTYKENYFTAVWTLYRIKN